jgi:integrase
LKIEQFPWPQDCLRHSFASYHLAMFESAEKTALQMGHNSTDMLFRHYRELVTKEQAEKFWALMPRTVDRKTKRC